MKIHPKKNLFPLSKLHIDSPGLLWKKKNLYVYKPTPNKAQYAVVSGHPERKEMKNTESQLDSNTQTTNDNQHCILI